MVTCPDGIRPIGRPQTGEVWGKTGGTGGKERGRGEKNIKGETEEAGPSLGSRPEGGFSSERQITVGSDRLSIGVCLAEQVAQSPCSDKEGDQDKRENNRIARGSHGVCLSP